MPPQATTISGSTTSMQRAMIAVTAAASSADPWNSTLAPTV